MAKNQRDIIAIKNESPMESLEQVRKRAEEEGGKNLLFRIPRLENTARHKWFLKKAAEYYNETPDQFIVTLSQAEAALHLGENSSSVELYEKNHLLETLYSDRGIYQLPPVSIKKWFSRKIK